MTKARDLSSLANGVPNSLINLDSAEIPNLDASKITTGELPNARIADLPASKITTGTFNDARISQSSVSQHATSFDDNKIVNDLSTLALRQATSENAIAYNTNSSFIDVFQDASGIATITNAERNSNEFVSTNIEIQETGGTTTAGGLAGWTSGYNSMSFTANSNTSITYTVTSGNHGYWGNRFLTGNYTFKFKTTATNTSASSTNTGFQMGIAINNSTSNSNGTNGIYGDNDSDNFYMGWNGLGNQTLYFYNAQTTQASVSANVTANYVFQFVRDNAGTLKVYGGEFTNPYSDGGTLLHTFTGYSNTGDDRPIVATGYPNGQNTNNGTVIASEFYINNNITTLDGGSTFNSTGNFIGTTITAPSSVSSMGAIITYQDQAGTNALNTDIVLELSADNGSNWSTATLSALPNFSTGIKMAKVNDLAVTAGTQLKYRINFANQSQGSKEARIRGVSLQY
jgi:hypothetical protein